MAKQKTTSDRAFKPKAKRNNKGVHSKKGSSKLKTSKNYKKEYKGQGR